ncbi:FkbM family methyltransferase [Pontibacter locisalis]|uniref:FkbM family methyltransferase n=1 Tax=Pontibacter locisalis TaxID=1719035 RepID=A0ABW5IHG9_9BACT
MYQKLARFFNKVVDLRFGNVSYAQEGEDLLLNRIFENHLEGVYVDVGAHHPKRFSNTYIFYKKGWRGINIDPMPKSMDVFNKIRPLDINLEVGISKVEQTLTYYMFDEPALNGFNLKVAEERNDHTNYSIIDRKQIKTLPLHQVLDSYLSENKRISFLSVDVEGLDLVVLESNNWEKYRPTIILVEILHSCIEDILKSDINLFLESKNYTLYCKTPNTVFYRNVDDINLVS